jgi:hypothetical protein
MVPHSLRNDLFFFIVAIAQFVLYDYFVLIDELPLSVHMWRQSDCLSFTMNFYNNGMDLTQPGIHHLLTGSGRTVAELPLMYYLVAGLYHVFGPHEWVYRTVWMLVWLGGSFAFYKGLLNYVKDAFWAIALSALLFCSPVLIFYANSFVIDPVALAISLMAWCALAQYYTSKRGKWLFWAIAGFSLAGVLKEPSLIPYTALVCLLLLRWVAGRLGFHKTERSSAWSALYWSIPFLLMVIWFFMKKEYNTIYPNAVFLAEIVPIWQLSYQEIHQVIEHVDKIWFADYFSPILLILTGCAFLINLWFIKRNTWSVLYMLLLFLGTVSYILLFFKQFQHHDYYIISILPLIPVVWLVLVMNFRQWTLGNTKQNRWVKAGFAVLVIIGVGYAADRQEERFHATWNWMIPDREKVHALKETGALLTELGIPQEAKVISIPDQTLNLTLYLLNRRGWSSIAGDNLTEESIRNHIALGASCMVVNDSNELKKPYLQPFLEGKLAEYKGITVIALPPAPSPP